MELFVVVGICQGVPSEVQAFTSEVSARQQGYELASQLNLLRRPWGWTKEDGRWNPKRGSSRCWEHHWYNDESDVVVTRCDLGE